GMLAGPAAVQYARHLEKGCESTDESVFEKERVRQREFNDRLLHQQGTENPIAIWREMGEWMTENVTVIRYNDKLKKTLGKVDELRDRYEHINLSDRTQWSNQTLQFCRELHDMLILAKAVTEGALARNETRGAHYKPEYPNRDDANWLKTTKASYQCGKITLEYEPVDISLLQPRERSFKAAN
ncbi:MAG: hypothetical protein WAR24_15260, partial [Candidatus Acidiferrales bacterium]